MIICYETFTMRIWRFRCMCFIVLRFVVKMNIETIWNLPQVESYIEMRGSRASDRITKATVSCSYSACVLLAFPFAALRLIGTCGKRKTFGRLPVNERYRIRRPRRCLYLRQTSPLSIRLSVSSFFLRSPPWNQGNTLVKRILNIFSASKVR